MTRDELMQSVNETREAVGLLAARFEELTGFCEQVRRDAIACLGECDQIAARTAE